MGNKNPKSIKKNKILVGSPVYQKPEILEAFLQSLEALNCGLSTMDFIFVDDNADAKSSCLLADFQRQESMVTILKGKKKTDYLCDVESHHWDDSLMLKVADYKNAIIQYAIDNDYEELFFADSDLILHPDLIIHLESRKKEVVSEIFWSQWHENLPLEPNVWLFDEYDLVPKYLGEELEEAEKIQRQAGFIAKLKHPGIYRVGGLGACTLINRAALLKGVNFAPISNLTIHGEDRFFCIRAAVLGIELFVDTCFPAYHIYRESDLPGAADYVKGCKVQSDRRITLSMVVRNEEGRYLERVLRSLAGHIDNAVIIDDASTDGTAAMCQRLLSGIPLKLVRNKESMFADEVSLRKKQWEETVKTNPDWILNLDGDELLEEKFWDEAQGLMNQPDNGRCTFRLYDMWNETQYREDEFWSAHNSSRTFLLRYQPEFPYQWRETPQHCGRFPANCDDVKKAGLEYRVQHLGWSKAADRESKYQRYQRLDPDAVYGIREQYESILDQNPRLISWQSQGAHTYEN